MFQSGSNVAKLLKIFKASQNFQSFSKISNLSNVSKPLKSMKYSNTMRQVGRIPRFTWARLHDRKLSSTTSNSLYSSSNLVVVDRYPAFFYIKSQTCYKRAALPMPVRYSWKSRAMPFDMNHLRTTIQNSLREHHVVSEVMVMQGDIGCSLCYC